MDYKTDVYEFESPIIKIDKKVIEMDDSIIQISNIASVSLRYPPKKGVSNRLIWGVLISLIGISIGNNLNSGISFIALISLCICAYFIYKVYQYNNDLGKNIIISTGSGGYFWINSKDDNFSLKVIEVIRKCMNGMDGEGMVFNFENLTNNGILAQGDVTGSTITVQQNEQDIPELRI